MILSNVEIHKALDEGRLIIDPQPKPRFKEIGVTYCPYDTHTVDLSLLSEIRIPFSGTFSYDLAQPGKIADFMARNCERLQLTEKQPYILQPNTFVLGMTRERVQLPLSSCLAARIEGKSSRARCGVLVHFTAPTVHPGWNGPLTLEIINLGQNAFTLRMGMPIAQLIIEEVRGTPVDNPSQFQGQVTPEGVPGASPPVLAAAAPTSRRISRRKSKR